MMLQGAANGIVRRSHTPGVHPTCRRSAAAPRGVRTKRCPKRYYAPMPLLRRSLLPLIVALLLSPQPGVAQSRPGGEHTGAPDPSPHRSGFVVRDGARLHYLDWGGAGPAVVLLPGYALTAHAFDDIGTLLARDFRVIALTPRGFGESDAPDSSEYTIATMVEDLLALLDSLHIERAALVGHSISGSTIAEFSRVHPARTSKLVFLDAFPYFAAAGGDSIDALSPVAAHGLTGEMTHTRVREFLTTYRFGGWSPALEADLNANTLGAELVRRRALTDGYVRDQRDHPPDVRAIPAPSLQICAVPTTVSEYPWVPPNTPQHTEAERYVREILQPFIRTLCRQFTTLVPGARAVEVAGSHYLFFLQPRTAATLIRRFLME